MSETHPADHPATLTATSLVQLRAACEAARSGTMRDAAAALFVSPSAISHHVRNLERDLGIRILERRRTGITVSDAARELIADSTRAFDQLDTALQRLRSRHLAGNTVTITVAPYLSARWLTPRLARLRQERPDVDVRLHHAYEPVDFTTDPADLGLVWGSGDWPNVTSTLLMDGRLTAVCNPEVAARLGRRARSPRDLAHALAASQLPLLYEFGVDDWHDWFRAHGVDLDVDLAARLARIDDTHALRSATLGGLGAALFARRIVAEELEQHLFVEIGEHTVGRQHYFLTVPTGRPHSPAARAVARWILREAELP